MILTNNWYSNGKFLITGEYLVLDGARAFALPLKFGQSLSVSYTNSGIISWKAQKPNGLWFDCKLSLPYFRVISADNVDLAKKISSILIAVSGMSQKFVNAISNGVDVTTNLSFNTEFGMGSSSTLMSNLAWWADVDPYKLLDITFGGSGYDIACARSNKPLIFIRNSESVKVENVDFKPDYRNSIFFVYLGKKQSSAKSILKFRNKAIYNSHDVEAVSKITNKIFQVDSLNDFESLVNEHEEIMSAILNFPTVKQTVFHDFTGSVKSMGAWGGDFVMMTWNQSVEELKSYLETKGISVFYAFDEIVLGA